MGVMDMDGGICCGDGRLDGTDRREDVVGEVRLARDWWRIPLRSDLRDIFGSRFSGM